MLRQQLLEQKKERVYNLIQYASKFYCNCNNSSTIIAYNYAPYVVVAGITPFSVALSASAIYLLIELALL